MKFKTTCGKCENIIGNFPYGLGTLAKETYRLAFKGLRKIRNTTESVHEQMEMEKEKFNTDLTKKYPDFKNGQEKLPAEFALRWNKMTKDHAENLEEETEIEIDADQLSAVKAVLEEAMQNLLQKKEQLNGFSMLQLDEILEDIENSLKKKK